MWWKKNVSQNSFVIIISTKTRKGEAVVCCRIYECLAEGNLMVYPQYTTLFSTTDVPLNATETIRGKTD